MYGNGVCNDEAKNAECNYDGGDCCVTPIELIGNGVCNDEANNAECKYDGGDCCVIPIELIGNGLCNDEVNNAECYNDGGDCCGACVNTEDCTECVCHVGGETTFDLSCK